MGNGSLWSRSHGSFGDELLHFARSIDIVSGDTQRFFLELLQTYAERYVLCPRYAILTDWNPGAGPQLCTFHTFGLGTAYPAIALHGDFDDALKFAYCKSKCLWITGANGEVLRNSDAFVNLWGARTELPRYRPLDSDGHTIAAIVLPLKWDTSVFGLLVFEIANAASPAFDRRVADDLRRIADATARILILHRASETQASGSREAAQRLGESLRHLTGNAWQRPKVFVASPRLGDPAVVEAIRGTLREFPNIEEVYWESVHDSGNINEHILNAIALCRFGICYLSEKRDGESNYRDNANVVFEAGMLQALTNSPMSAPKGWIPIREAEERSGRAPFDFAQERMIVVTRTPAGNFTPPHRKKFCEWLQKRIEALVIDPG
jgi:hypothetical protein